MELERGAAGEALLTLAETIVSLLEGMRTVSVPAVSELGRAVVKAHAAVETLAGAQHVPKPLGSSPVLPELMKPMQIEADLEPALEAAA